MQTLMLQADDKGIRRAAEIIQQGGLVGIPTETVYGLAGNALNGSDRKDRKSGSAGMP
mgnify:CR=1 FL=1